MKTIEIANRPVGDGQPPYIIAEACVNHQGDPAMARRMVHIAHALGADAIKFQMHVPDNEMLPVVPGSDNFAKPLRQILLETELSEEVHRELIDLCASLGIQYLCTPFSRVAADKLEQLGLAAYKIGSGEMTNLPLLEHIARKGRPMIVSTGMCQPEEIDETVAMLRDVGVPFALTHCVSAYPAPHSIVNLGLIPKYRDRYQVPVGLSDHSDGIYTCLGAVALGASILEKHFTLDKFLPGPDHRVSIEPNELDQLVKGARAVFEAGGCERRIFAEEEQIVAWARESVVSEMIIPAGTRITADMVWVKRPSPGPGVAAAKDLQRVIGRETRVVIPADTQIRWEDLA